MADDKKRKVAVCIPTITKPYQQCLDSLAASAPVLSGAGWEMADIYEIGNPYISAARSALLRKALDAKADVIVFIDHDLSWEPQGLLKLIETEGPVISGTYRFKRDEVEYMGALLPDIHGRPQVRTDGCVKAHSVPAGFLKLTRNAVNRFMLDYPELCYGDRFALNVDLFNHGAWQGTWYGEDYAFARRWREKCGEVWIVPDLNITHWTKLVHPETQETICTPYPGNFHQYLLAQEGGSESDCPEYVEPVVPKVVKMSDLIG
jgi:hypothetical protein